ncbi:MAG TPA: ATP-binding protein [Verrucomicrobiae bacterium]|nr:ATP-binding protein [Verrucomicrobiae bacterium]
MATILLIDDESGFRNTAALALRNVGYNVLEAGDTQTALGILQSDVPDLIISDICMRGGDGISLLRQVRANTHTASVPFIFMSGNADHDTMVLGAEQAADGFLPKPFTVHSLLTTVSKRLSRDVLARQASEEIKFQLLKILEGAPDLIAMLDPETHRLQFLNATGRTMLGYDRNFDLSNLHLQAIHAHDRDEHVDMRMLDIAFQKGQWSGETALRRKSGEIFPVRAYIQAHRDHSGKCAYLSVIAHDLTGSKQLEKERKAMELQLTQAHKLESIGQLAAGIAHEINTPTQYIGDNTRFIQQSFAALHTLLPRFQELLHAAKQGVVHTDLIASVEKASVDADLDFLMAEIPLAIQQSLEGLDRVTKIVRAMKDFSHPGVNEKTPIDLNHAIESTVTVARNEWKYVAELELDLDKELPLVPCLPGEINQLVLNLVVNASHAIEEVVSKNPGSKGHITVRTSRIPNGVQITVQDTGAGIPEAVRSKIFNPFFTTKEVGKGTGQGLAIARSVMAKHGGTIDFDSEVGKGTAFYVRLPLSSELQTQP